MALGVKSVKKSRMMGDCQVRFCERLGVKIPRPTRLLSRISQIMAKNGLGPGAFVYVADSAMVTEKNLSAMGPN